MSRCVYESRLGGCGAPVYSVVDMGRDRNQRTPVQAALDAARAGERDRLLSLMESLNFANCDRVDERWLHAEELYRQGRYAESLNLFADFDHLETRETRPAWQKYLSAHRQAFSSFQLGLIADAEGHLDRAERILLEAPDECHRLADVIAMRAHFLELRGDFDGALAMFERAFAEAIAGGNRTRAITAASDVARVLGILGRVRDGLAWLTRAEELQQPDTNALVRRTLQLRRGMLLAMLGLRVEAEACYSAVLDSATDGSTPGLQLDVLARRADVRRLQTDYAGAEHDLLEAIALGERFGLARHVAHALCDLASLRLERGASGDHAAAVLDFRNALTHLPSPPPPVQLLQFADTVLAMPAIVNRERLPPDRRAEIQSTVNELRESLAPGLYQRSTRATKVDILTRRLLILLEALGGRIIILRSHTVDFGAKKVSAREGHGKSSRAIGSAELELLDHLADQSRGRKPSEIADSMNITLQSALKRLSRLGRLIGTDLQKVRKGNERFYSVLRQSSQLRDKAHNIL